jgi:hypothetical protein
MWSRLPTALSAMLLMAATVHFAWHTHYFFWRLLALGLAIWWLYLQDAQADFSQEDAFNDPGRYQFFNASRQFFKIISFFVLGLSIVDLWISNLPWPSLCLFLIGLFLGYLYVHPVLKNKSQAFKIKRIPYLKSFYVTAGWWLAIIFCYPLFHLQNSFNLVTQLPWKHLTWNYYFFGLMLLLLADTLFLDWLDRKGDRKQKIKTLAVGLPFLGQYLPWAMTIFIFISASLLFLISKFRGPVQWFYSAFIFSSFILMITVLLSYRVKPKNRFWINYGFEAWRICFAIMIIAGY